MAEDSIVRGQHTKKEGFSLKKIYSISLSLGSILGGHNLAWSQYATVEVTNGGVIQGHVTFAGEAPAPKILQVSQSLEVCGKSTLYDESLIVSSESQGLKNAVVFGSTT